MKIKRIALIIGFILIVLFFGYLLYVMFFRPAPSTTPSPTTQTPNVTPEFPVPGAFVPPPTTPTTPSEFPQGQRPIAETVDKANGDPVQTIEIQSDRNTAISPTGDGTVVTYDFFDQKFYRISPDGTQVALTDQEFPGLDSVVFSSNSDKAIIEFYDGSNILYDFNAKKQVTLPKHWREFSFSTTGSEIAFKSLTGEADSNWLAIASADGSAGEQIEPLGNNSGLVDVTWSPSNQIIATYREVVDGFHQKIYFLGKKGENFKAATINGRGFQSQWTPDGKRLVYSAYSGDSDLKPLLWVVDALGDTIGNNRRNLQVNTWIDKCAFVSNELMYCAVPSRMDSGGGVVRSLSDKGPDYIYSINLDTGQQRKVAEPSEPHTISQIVIENNNLFFTDKNSGKLYTIKLK
ncbi:MAG: hypothetical protein Q8P11_00170 [bacterium]|nr:hypothetical protein [bacterium]